MFIVQNKETGIEIEEVNTLLEARQILAEYEAEDSKEGNYTNDFYEIKNKETDEIVE